MIKNISIYKIIFSFLLLTSINVEARKIDPSWQVMIDSSDIIAKVQFVTSGSFEAKAKIIQLFKGEYSGEEILIKGYSNKDENVNHLRKETKYIVFLNKKGNDFNTWSTTAGFLKIEKKKIQYDLLQTTNHSLQNYYSLKVFENFLSIAIDKNVDHSKFYKSKLSLVKNNLLYPICSQYISMLQLSGYREYNDMFLEIMFNQDPDARIALTRFLGAVHTDKARENIVTLLNDNDEIVAEEAANQLIYFEPEFAGEALLRKFKELGRSNDLRNDKGSISQFKLKLIKSLVQINYKPAGEFIVPMLQTKNKYLFNLTLDALVSLESKNYLSYFEKHIEDNDDILFHDIFDHLIKFNIGEELIVDFIKTHNRNNLIDYSYLVSSKGLGVYKDSTLSTFIINDFNEMINSELDSVITNRWVINYFDFLIGKKSKDQKNEVYNLSKKLININFDLFDSDTIFSGDTNVLVLKNTFVLNLLASYLSAVGGLEDLIFLHKMEAFIHFDELERNKILIEIDKLEKRINLNIEEYLKKQ